MSLAHYNFGAMTDAQKVVGKAFLKKSTFAVVGASKDQMKVGNKVASIFEHDEDLDNFEIYRYFAVSLHLPKYAPPSLRASSYTAPDIGLWQITLLVLEKAKELNVPSYWIQAGAEDETVLKYIEENGLSDRVVCGGPCILVLGDGIRSHL
ncbi:hypothetical protein C0989_012084 [Termitomyces sp. Mn162]|nr:hypothetical protein C0989_012084 [Termitomyces sp. Mn162]